MVEIDRLQKLVAPTPDRTTATFPSDDKLTLSMYLMSTVTLSSWTLKPAHLHAAKSGRDPFLFRLPPFDCHLVILDAEACAYTRSQIGLRFVPLADRQFSGEDFST